MLITFNFPDFRIGVYGQVIAVDKYRIMAGEHDQEVEEGTEVLYDVEEVIPHEQYLQVSSHTVQNSTVQYSTVQYSTVQYSTVQYNTIQYNTVLYHANQYSSIQCNAYMYACVHVCMYATLYFSNK